MGKKIESRNAFFSTLFFTVVGIVGTNWYKSEEIALLKRQITNADEDSKWCQAVVNAALNSGCKIKVEAPANKATAFERLFPSDVKIENRGEIGPNSYEFMIYKKN